MIAFGRCVAVRQSWHTGRRSRWRMLRDGLGWLLWLGKALPQVLRVAGTAKGLGKIFRALNR